MWCPKCTKKTIVTSTYAEESVTRSRRCTQCNYSFMSKEAILTDSYWNEYANYTYELNCGEEEKKKIDALHKQQGVLFK